MEHNDTKKTLTIVDSFPVLGLSHSRNPVGSQVPQDVGDEFPDPPGIAVDLHLVSLLDFRGVAQHEPVEVSDLPAHKTNL